MLMKRADNINYYKCDVTKYEELQAVHKLIVEEVRSFAFSLFSSFTHRNLTSKHKPRNKTLTDRTPHRPHQQRRRRAGQNDPRSLAGRCTAVSFFPVLSLPPIHVTRLRTVDVNLVAQFWALKTFLPDMIRNKSGHIVGLFYLSEGGRELNWNWDGVRSRCRPSWVLRALRG